MSYFEETTIYVGNRHIESLIKELLGIKKTYKNKKVSIGSRICDNECDMYGQCDCDVYSLNIEDK